MEDNNNIDDIFKSALDDLEMEPSAKSWDNLSSKLAAKRAVRTRRRAGLWFSAAALLLILSYTSYRLLNNSAPNVQDNKQIEENTTVQPSTPNNSSVGTDVNATHENATPSNAPSAVQSGNPKVSNSEPTASTSNVIAPSPSTPTSSLPRNSSSNISDNTKSNTGLNVAPVVVAPKVSQPVASVPKSTTIPVAKTGTSNSAKTESPSASNASTKSVQSNSNTKSGTQPSTAPQQTTQPSSQQPQVQSANNQTATTANPDNTTNTNSTPADDRKGIIPAATVAGAGTAAAAANNPNSNSTGNNSNSPSQDNSGTQANSDSKPATDSQAHTVGNETKTTDQNPPTEPINADLNNPQPPIDSAQLKNGQNPNASGSLVKRIASHLGLEVYYTPELAHTKMEVNNDYQGPASKDLNDYKNESTQYSYSAGINLSYKIGNHWSVVGGYAISDYSKSAVYNTIAVVADSVYQDQYVENPGGHPGGSGHHHDPGHHGGGGWHGGGGGPGGSGNGGGGWHGHENPNHPGDAGANHHFIIHTPCGSIDLNNVPPSATSVNNGDTLNVKTETFQSIHFYSFPLLARYSFGTKKISYFVEGGGAINYVRTDVVKVVINDATTEENSLDAISNMNYTLLFGVGAKYNFYKGFNFFLKPSFRYSITPINVDSPVNSYPYYLGIGGGFSFDF